jgi:hypothetical protein
MEVGQGPNLGCSAKGKKKPTENHELKWKERRIKGGHNRYMITVLWDVTPYNLVDR